MLYYTRSDRLLAVVLRPCPFYFSPYCNFSKVRSYFASTILYQHLPGATEENQQEFSIRIAFLWGRDLTTGPPEYEAGVLNTLLLRSILLYKTVLIKLYQNLSFYMSVKTGILFQGKNTDRAFENRELRTLVSKKEEETVDWRQVYNKKLNRYYCNLHQLLLQW
jgi:hypothetical protein